MRHRKAGSSRFGRRPDERLHMLRNQMISLIEHERIQTTAAKARTVRPMVEKLISISRHDTPSNRLLVWGRLGNNYRAMTKLFDEVGPRMSGRSGGYTRIYKLHNRRGDGAPIVQIELVD
jgi:large subunit ribosomal protein L17